MGHVLKSESSETPTPTELQQVQRSYDIMSCVLLPSQIQEHHVVPSILSKSSAKALFGACKDEPSALAESSSSVPRVLQMYKGDRTSLKFRVESSGDIRKAGSKRLRSCNTIASFFQIVCHKCDITEASISTISVKFPWFPQDHPRQEIRNDRDIECIKTLIHEVDNAPCWEDETDYCKLPVRVVKKPGWDEGHNQAACRCIPAQKSRWSSRGLKGKSARESPKSEDWWQMPGCPSGSGRTCLAVMAGLEGLCLAFIARILRGGG